MIDEASVEALESLGFSRDRIIVALNHESDPETAAQWIIDHEDQEDSWWEAQKPKSANDQDSPVAEAKRSKTIYSAVELLRSNDESVFAGSVKVLVRVLNNILKDPLAEKFRSLKLEKERIQADIVKPKGALACLTAVGFIEQENVLVLPLDADVEQVEELRDVLEAATVAGVQNEAAGAPQTAHTPPATDKSADESGVVPVDELVRAESKSADFVRFEAEEVAAETVAEVNAYCQASGEQFVDPAFPPINRSLYKSEEWATMWQCMDCGTMNDLPAPLSKELMMMSIPRPPQVCKACNKPATRINTESRPTQWLRPRDIRDDVTLQVGGTPWVIFREEPRSDDVRQGALGNCWFVGALSVVAERPDLIRRMFLAGSHEVNPNAAYQLRLCRDGVWHTVLVDDVFPCTNLEMLAYSKASRRQLWVPLVEKAAAKLFGCYQHLSSGTLSEALTLFTGFPSEQVMLGGRGQQQAPPENADPETAAAFAEQAALALKSADPEALWQKLLASKDKGFIMGTACVAVEARNRGLQAPHAYGILDMREISKDLRLLKLRNPWGQDKWDGHWGTHSSKWVEREDLKRLLRPEREDAGVFWISWEDMIEYFASVEICRVRQDWTEVRTSGWLPSSVGLGTAVEFSCFTETELDIVMHQEGHIVRGDTISHLCDLGFAVIRKSSDDRYELMDDTTRQMDSMVSKCVSLGEGTYYIVPLCFNQLSNTAPRKYSLVTHSSQPLLTEKKACEPQWMAETMIQRAIKYGKRVPLTADGLVSQYSYTGINERRGESGLSVVIENYSHTGLTYSFDLGDKNGTVCSRRSHCCQDVIPGQKRALLAILSPEEGHKGYGWSFGHDLTRGSNEEYHVPELDPSDRVDPIHLAQDCPPLDPSHPSQSTPIGADGAPGQAALADILRNIGAIGAGGTGPAPGEPTPGASPAANPADLEEEMLQAAIRASLGDGGGGGPTGGPPPS